MVKTSKDFILVSWKEKEKNKRLPLAISIICCLLLACISNSNQSALSKEKVTHCVSVVYPEAVALPTAGPFWEAGRLPPFPGLCGRRNHAKAISSCLQELQNSEQWF